jgi:hypothetical protein
MGELESSFRRLSLRLERAACLSSWAGSVEVDGSGVEAVEEWLRYDGEGRVETSDMMEQKKGLREDWRSVTVAIRLPPGDAVSASQCLSMATNSSLIRAGLVQETAFAMALFQDPFQYHRSELSLA